MSCRIRRAHGRQAAVSEASDGKYREEMEVIGTD
jgi:hypothetical protein